MSITLTSTAFERGAPIPAKFTSEGPDVSPALAWSGVPAGTKELALICDDPDAPRPTPWVHWVLYKIPPSTTALPENLGKAERLPSGAIQGRNTWGTAGYQGPEPPRGHGVHHYHFRLYALDTTLESKPGMDKDQLLAAMKNHIIATGEVIGTYERK